MAHPNEEMIRAAYTAFGRGDLDGYCDACTEDFAFNVPGNCRASGRYLGRAGIQQIGGMVGEICGPTFQETVEDVLANDEHGVVLALHRFTRDGQPKEYRTAHVYDIRDGKLAECWEQPQDQTTFEDAWGPRA